MSVQHICLGRIKHTRGIEGTNRSYRADETLVVDISFLVMSRQDIESLLCRVLAIPRGMHACCCDCILCTSKFMLHIFCR